MEQKHAFLKKGSTARWGGEVLPINPPDQRTTTIFSFVLRRPDAINVSSSSCFFESAVGPRVCITKLPVNLNCVPPPSRSTHHLPSISGGPSCQLVVSQPARLYPPPSRRFSKDDSRRLFPRVTTPSATQSA